VDLNAEPKNRDIVLIYLNGSYYLKRFECCDGKVTLASTNYAFPKIVLTDTDDWFILGVYVRKL
ncbi:MAG: S24 family peptidase, partial [Ignavibacteria bacterium]|nr:S24 family peptidase [Ignavibacteria bacterium]